MFILNITFKTTWAVHATWLEWLRNNWLQKMQTADPVPVQLVRLLDVDDTDGPTLAVQWQIPTLAILETMEQQWLREGMPLLHTVWGSECVYFASKMEVVQ